MMPGLTYFFSAFILMALPLFAYAQEADSTTVAADTTTLEAPKPVAVQDTLNGTTPIVAAPSDTLGLPPSDSLNAVKVATDTLVNADTVAVEQKADVDTEKPKEEKGEKSWNGLKPGPHITVDIGKFSSFATDFEDKYDFSIGYLFSNRFAIEVEGGVADLFPNNAFENGVYEASGSYFKAGFDYHIPLNINARNNFMVGLRYAMGSFEDNLRYEIGSELWQNFGEAFERTDLSADWFELVFSSEMIMTGNLFLGWKLRIRFMNEYDEQTPLDVWAVPGYGRTFDNSVPALNVYLKYRFAF